MQCTNCGHVNGEDAAFCSACGTQLARSCPNCSSPYSPGDAFCSSCGAKLESAQPSSDTEVSRYVPAELLDKLNEARRGRTMAGERRMVTMLFADVQGSTAAAEQLDPEEWADIMNGAFERLMRPVYRYEGTLARLMGDAILAFFGAPIAHEDDPERAVRAGLAILEDIRPYAREVKARAGVEFDVRVGINTGLVVVGEVGSDLRVEYTALGDAVNVAARMEQTTLPGTLQITADTQRLVESLFDFEELEPVEVKGKSDPVPAYRVNGVRARPASVRGLRGRETRLAGREPELAELHHVADDIRMGKGRVCSIIGEAGVGKSRLIAALREDLDAAECRVGWQATDEPAAEKIRWAEARCLSYDTTVAYAPFVDLFSRVFGLAADDDAATSRGRIAAAVESVTPDEADQIVPYLCALMGIPPGGSDDLLIADLPAPALQRRTFSAVVEYLRACTRSTPGIIVFEDLHWADSVSLALLDEILTLTDRSMLGVIALMRPYREDGSWRFHEQAERTLAHRYTSVQLAPLDEGACHQLLADLLGDAEVAPPLEEAVLDKADGNPFFLEELVRGMMESGTLREVDGRWVADDAVEQAVPSGITGLLTARLDRLDGASKLVTQLASVLGREFEFGELSTLVGDGDATDAAVTDLLRRELLVERSRIPVRQYAFRHALIQETAYSTLLLKERRELHARVADHLIARSSEDPEESEEPQEIARHLLESRQENRAVPFLVAAGDRAVRAMALADAIKLYDQALTWIGDGTDPGLVTRAHDGMGTAYSLIPDLTRAAAAYQQLLEFGKARSEPSVQIAALNRLGFASAILGGDYEAATNYLEDARRLAEEVGDEMGLAEYHMNSCMIATTRGDMEIAAAHDAETARLGSELGATEVHVGGLLQRALSLLHGARYEEGARALEQAKKVAEGTEDPRVLSSLAAAEFFLLLRDGKIAEAWESMRGATELATRVGSSTASVLALQAGSTAALLGDYESALAYFGQSLRLGEEAGQLFNAAAAAASMAHIYGELGVEDDEVRGLRDTAIGHLEVPMGETLASTVHAELGWAALERDDVEGAIAAFGAGLAGTSATKQLELPSLQLGLATARILSGGPGDARDLIEGAASHIEEREMTFYRPLAALVRASHAIAEGRPSEAVAVLDEGLGDAVRMGTARFEWRMRAARASALAGAGASEEAVSEIGRAQQAIQAQAQKIVDPATRESFLETANARLATLTGAASS